MSRPTAGETAFAQAQGLAPETVARARDVFNSIASLAWPQPERVALLSRLARAAKADVGKVLGGLALARAPLDSFEQLVALDGLAERRVAGLARGLAVADAASFSQPITGLLDAYGQLDALRAENAALRSELDRLRALQPAGGAGTPAADERMRLADLAASLSEQIAQARHTLAGTRSGLTLGSVALELRGRATALDQELALDFAPAGGERSSVGLAFVPQRGDGVAAEGDATVPDVAGYAPALATRKLQQAGFAVVLTQLGQAQGRVAAQQPPAGALAAAGSTVRLLVR